MQTSLVEKRDAELVDTQAKLVSCDRQAGQYEKELANMRAKLEAKESELEAVRLRLPDAEKGWTSLDELIVSPDQVGQYEKELANVRAKLEAKESELEAIRLQLPDAEKRWTSLDELIVSPAQVGQYEKELANVRAKLEAKESELEAVRLQLTDAERDLNKSKAGANELRAQTATGSVNIDEDHWQITRRLMERMRVLEMALTRWNDKSIEGMECRNEG
jgi:chromosome segregation ATPase